MNFRQRLLRFIYPLFITLKKKQPARLDISNEDLKMPPKPIYDIEVKSIDGQPIELKKYSGKKLLIVNTASECGFTPQFETLEKLWKGQSATLTILGVPSNDFKGQDPGENSEIANFCRRNYGVSFPLSQKAQVSSGPSQHPLFRWLTNPELNGWNDQAPTWNFTKYLVDEEGRLTHVFDPAIEPLDEKIIKAINS